MAQTVEASVNITSSTMYFNANRFAFTPPPMPPYLPPPPPPFEPIVLPSSCLLDQVARIEDCENATTAYCYLSDGELVKVTFVVAEPPRLSHFCVHCPGIDTKLGYARTPRIHHSVDNIALISVSFSSAWSRNSEYLFYKAGRHGRRPSLQHLEGIGDYFRKKRDVVVASVGFLPRGNDVVLVALTLSFAHSQEELHVFRSEQSTWTSKVLVLESHQKLYLIERVLDLGSGEIGFVNLSKGILACSVLTDDPTVRFIPLPVLLPGNKSHDQSGDARSLRDVVFKDGVLKCVEMEHCYQRIVREKPRRVPRLPDDVSEVDVLHDSDMMADIGIGPKEEDVTYKYTGWRLIAWRRSISSTSWHKDFLFHMDDLRINDPAHVVLGHRCGSPLTLKDVMTCVPTLSIDDTNSLYLITDARVPQTLEHRLRVILVNMWKKTLEDVSPVHEEGPNNSSPACSSCSLFKRLDADS